MSSLAIKRFEPVRAAVILPRQCEVPRSVFGLSREHFKRLQEFVQSLTPTLEDYATLMAGSKSNYLSKKQIEEIAGGVSFTPPANVFYALWTATLSDTSTGATAGEATYTSYARVSVTNDQSTGWNAGTGTTTSTVTNKGTVNWPAATGGSSTCTFLGLLDSTTIGAGNMLFWTDITSVAVTSGVTPQLAAGALSLVDD